MADSTTIREPQPRRGRRGLTLIELVTAVAVLAIIILSFGKILSSSQRAVSIAQRNMRLNSQALAISQTVRADTRQASQQGFVSITEVKGGRPMLVYSGAAGVVDSMLRANFSHNYQFSATGTGTMTVVCLAPGEGVYDGDVLVRQQWIMGRCLDYQRTLSSDLGDDVDGSLDFADLAFSPRKKAGDLNDIQDFIDRAAERAPDGMTLPPENEVDIDSLWKVLAPGCRALSIMWTDGSVDGGNMNWYGVDFSVDDDGDVSYSVKPRDSNYSSKDIDTPAGDGFVAEYEKGGAYHATWTSDDPSAWPRAIKLRFLIRDLTLKSNRTDITNEGVEYEVICPLGS